MSGVWFFSGSPRWSQLPCVYLCFKEVEVDTYTQIHPQISPAGLCKATVWSLLLLCWWTAPYYGLLSKCSRLIIEYTREVRSVHRLDNRLRLALSENKTLPFISCTVIKLQFMSMCVLRIHFSITHKYFPTYLCEYEPSMIWSGDTVTMTTSVLKQVGSGCDLGWFSAYGEVSASRTISARCRWALSSLKWKCYCRRRDALSQSSAPYSGDGKWVRGWPPTSPLCLDVKHKNRVIRIHSSLLFRLSSYITSLHTGRVLLQCSNETDQQPCNMRTHTDTARGLMP